MTVNVQELFGQIDIYVFDQILRGNISPGMRILDAGCGYGRNLVYLLREGFEIFAIDANSAAVEDVRELSKSLKTGLPDDKREVRIELAVDHLLRGLNDRARALAVEQPERLAANGLFAMPDGQSWYLVDERKLMGLTASMKGVLVDPLKTTIVQNHRCMTTWVVRKPHELG